VSKMEVTKEGIICPWCPHRPPIRQCPHNPFKLMEKIEDMEVELSRLRNQQVDYTHLRNAIKRLIA